MSNGFSAFPHQATAPSLDDNVHPGTQGCQTGMGRGLRDALDGMEVSHCPVVGDEQTIQPHLLAQQPSEQPDGGGNRLSAHGIIGRHRTAQPSQENGGLEGLTVRLYQQAVGDVAVRSVDGAFGVVRSDKVLRHRLSATAPIAAASVGSSP
jgi:hypothetical protein